MKRTVDWFGERVRPLDLLVLQNNSMHVENSSKVLSSELTLEVQTVER